MNRKYRAVYAPLLVHHMQQGYSFESFAAWEIDKTRLLANDDPPALWAKDWPDFRKEPVTLDVLRHWLAHHDDFAQAKESGHTAALLFYEEQLTQSIRGKLLKGQARPDTRALLFVLASRFAHVYGTKKTTKTVLADESRNNDVDIRYINDPEQLALAARCLEERAHREQRRRGKACLSS